MQSLAYEIARAVVAITKPVAATAGATFLDNPAFPLDLKNVSNERALFVVHRGDRVQDQPGQQREKRRVRLLVGAVALTSTPQKDADALHFAARVAMRSDALRALFRAAGDVSAVREVEVEPELKEISTEGSALMSAFEIDYFQTYPAA